MVTASPRRGGIFVDSAVEAAAMFRSDAEMIAPRGDELAKLAMEG